MVRRLWCVLRSTKLRIAKLLPPWWSSQTRRVPSVASVCRRWAHAVIDMGNPRDWLVYTERGVNSLTDEDWWCHILCVVADCLSPQCAIVKTFLNDCCYLLFWKIYIVVATRHRRSSLSALSVSQVEHGVIPSDSLVFAIYLQCNRPGRHTLVSMRTIRLLCFQLLFRLVHRICI